MVDPSMQGWVHHVQHILPQGRCSWYDPFQKPEDDFEDEDLDEDEEEKLDDVQPETGPTLLSPVAEDERKSASITEWNFCTKSITSDNYIAVNQSVNRSVSQSIN